ncbi:hypothetical protein HJ057_12235 [Vibrio parahaemolyticus]|nr:hypothetical protein [Vibrio parahaemolyticus]
MNNVISVKDLPLSLLNHRHKAIDSHLKIAILADLLKNKIIEDGIETGNFEIGKDGQLFLKTNMNFESFAGFMFESYCVNEINTSKIIKEKCYRCATGKYYARDSINTYYAIGTGLLTTKSKHTHLYSTSSNMDILFVRDNEKLNVSEPANIKDSTIHAGIQLKAIRSNFKEEIIEPILSGKYDKVLTLLNKDSRMHSYDECRAIIRRMWYKSLITEEEKIKLYESIYSPEQLGFDRQEIEDYYELAKAFYFKKSNADKHIFNAIALESTNYKMNDAGILVPENIST